jgi:hypothetical protein
VREDRAGLTERIRREQPRWADEDVYWSVEGIAEMDPVPFARWLRALAEEDDQVGTPERILAAEPTPYVIAASSERPLLDGGSALSRADRAELTQRLPPATWWSWTAGTACTATRRPSGWRPRGDPELAANSLYQPDLEPTPHGTARSTPWNANRRGGSFMSSRTTLARTLAAALAIARSPPPAGARATRRPGLDRRQVDRPHRPEPPLARRQDAAAQVAQRKGAAVAQGRYYASYGHTTPAPAAAQSSPTTARPGWRFAAGFAALLILVGSVTFAGRAFMRTRRTGATI